MTTVGSTSLLTALFALIFVIALAYGLARLLRKIGFDQNTRKGKRLSITETLQVDAKRRLVLVRCDNWEATILTGPAGDLLVHRREDAQ